MIWMEILLAYLREVISMASPFILSLDGYLVKEVALCRGLTAFLICGSRGLRLQVVLHDHGF